MPKQKSTRSKTDSRALQMARRAKTLAAQTAQDKKRFLESLAAQLGNVSSASQATGIGRRTHYDWMAQDKAYEERVREIGLEQSEFVESKLLQLINGVIVEKETRDGPVVYRTPPDNASIIFYLKTRGKGLGYTERIEVNHTGAQVLDPKVPGEE